MQAAGLGCNEANGKDQKIPARKTGAAEPNIEFLHCCADGMFRIYFLIPLLIPLALVRRDFFGSFFRVVEKWINRLAAVPERAVVLVGAVAFLLSMALSLWNRIPVPHIEDEFGYLLLGDTFSHGRATNPAPPLWQHFETIHEIMQPTYTAKYPPAQGVALAIGALLGLPIIGIWLTTGLACAAVYWMLLAWMPRQWALAGGLMVALHPLILEWSQNYWGGAVAMGGGAVVLGAFRRILREPRARDAVWMGIGLGVLANSRPYEGFVIGALALLALAIGMIRRRVAPLSVLFRRVLLPLAGVLVVLAAQMAYYNWRVTGRAKVMPYMVHEDTYGLAPVFLFSKPHPAPLYRHPQIQRFQELYLKSYEDQHRSAGALLRATGRKIGVLGQGYLWSYLMVIPLLGLPCALRRDRWLRLVLAMGLISMIAMLLGTWLLPHYAAPAAGIFFLLVVESMRCLNAWHRGRWRPGRNIVRGLAILFVVSYFQVGIKMAGEDREGWYLRRQALLDELGRQVGKSLVIVRYSPDHNPNREWVYNSADIPGAKVILARDMGPEANRELLNYFHDRKAWLLNADDARSALEPYPGS